LCEDVTVIYQRHQHYIWVFSAWLPALLYA